MRIVPQLHKTDKIHKIAESCQKKSKHDNLFALSIKIMSGVAQQK